MSRRTNLAYESELVAVTTPGDTASARVVYDAATGCEHLVQHILTFSPGKSMERAPGACDEVLFVLSGSGILHLGSKKHELEPECGAYIKPGEKYKVENLGPEPLVIHSVTVPAPPADVETGKRAVTVRLEEQQARNATGAREFRLVTDPHVGCPSVTQFVGYIPPGRAPDHFHTYDEVIYILEGMGKLHIGDLHEPIGRGSCIHLTPKLVHSLENTGSNTMRVLGIFRPAGSPAEAYYPDGTLAYDYKAE